MNIVDAIKALKGHFDQGKKELADEKEAHLVTMTERDEAREALQPTFDALAVATQRAEAAEAVIAKAEEELGIEAEEEIPAEARPKGKG